MKYRVTYTSDNTPSMDLLKINLKSVYDVIYDYSHVSINLLTSNQADDI